MKLSDILQEQTLREFQDAISSVTNVLTVICDPDGRPLIEPSGPPALLDLFPTTGRGQERISRILKEIYMECGLKARLAAPMIGWYLRFTLRREAHRLRRGHTYEPPTFCETNWSLIARATSVIA